MDSERIIQDLVRLEFSEEQAELTYKTYYEKDEMEKLENYIAVRDCLATIL